MSSDGFVTWEEIRRAFANLIVMADSPTNAKTGINKIDRIKYFIDNDDPQVFYFLAAYVFDLHLRMVYIVEALEHLGIEDADPTFVKTVERELKQINGDPRLPYPKNWEAIAKDAYEVMTTAHERIQQRFNRSKIVDEALR